MVYENNISNAHGSSDLDVHISADICWYILLMKLVLGKDRGFSVDEDTAIIGIDTDTTLPLTDIGPHGRLRCLECRLHVPKTPQFYAQPAPMCRGRAAVAVV